MLVWESDWRRYKIVLYHLMTGCLGAIVEQLITGLVLYLCAENDNIFSCFKIFINKPWFHFWYHTQPVQVQLQKTRLRWSLNPYTVEQTWWLCLNVSNPLTRCDSSTRKLKLLFVCANLSIACLRVSVFLLVTGESILGINLFLRVRLPAERRAPRSRSMVGSESAVEVSSRINWPTVAVLIRGLLLCFTISRTNQVSKGKN